MQGCTDPHVRCDSFRREPPSILRMARDVDGNCHACHGVQLEYGKKTLFGDAIEP